MGQLISTSPTHLLDTSNILDSELIAPAFSLPDDQGNEFFLQSRRHVGATVLVFIRGHWCPYCRRYLSKLQANYYRFVERNVALIAIGPEPVQTARGLVRDLALSFPVLADVDGRVIDLFGTRNGLSSVKTLVPHPAVVIIDAELSVRFKSIDRNYKKRTTIRNIFQVLDEIGCD